MKTKKKIKVKKYRYIVIILIIGGLFAGLIGRLFYVMVTVSPKLKVIASDQQKSELTIDAKRGRILDRNTNELAISEDIYRVDLDLITVRQTLKTSKITLAQLANSLASILNMKPDRKSVV